MRGFILHTATLPSAGDVGAIGGTFATPGANDVESKV
jgi:hypothetical protein